MTPTKTVVIGSGGWGTALSVIWSRQGRNVLLWGRDPARIEQLQKTRENSAHLAGVKIPDSIGLTSDLKACAGADLIVFVTRSTALRDTATQLKNVQIKRDAALLSCVKGIEYGSGKRMSEILKEIFPDHPITVLSGPNLATEVARELPTATVLACRQPEIAADLQRCLSTSRFRIYTSEEVAGVELGGALKNVFAIAAGAGDGLGLGDNSKAALVTRALTEMVRLGTKMGGELRTFYGLSGAGDLIATCFSRQSRNRQVGEHLGHGLSIDEITAKMGTVAEGIPTTKSAYECARRLEVDTPIIDQVYSLIYEGKSSARAMEELLQRDQKAEVI
ncbi:MAG TPA: NAD(P)H-dependent glycerol-3-phosphate dehydrogenase [Chthoniobacterales bacterium]